MDLPSTSTRTELARPSSSSRFSSAASAAVVPPAGGDDDYTSSVAPAALKSTPPKDATEGQPSRNNCDRRRPDEENPSRLVNMSAQLLGKTVTPFLREHIPGIYAPIGKPEAQVPPTLRQEKNPNSKFCYRHRPDAKCRRAADENKMVMIQSALDRLPNKDQQAITHVWSLFSAAPAKHRDLMLQGILTQCCFPQLSTVSREVHEQLKIDFLTALPVEISYKILCYLDTVSLCRAAQVSRRWRDLANDDVVWLRMCKQHIDRKCTQCGWGLPLLERKRLRDWTRAQQLAKADQPGPSNGYTDTDEAPVSPDSHKRQRLIDDYSRDYKRHCTNGAGDSKSRAQLDEERKFRPWKDVYRDRYKVGSNWKYGRCSIKSFRGHDNGVTCLQFDDSVMATGSYDSTIKFWNLDTGEVIKTLRGHQSGIRALQFNSSILVSGSLDHTIKIWNWQTGECLSTLRCHSEGVITVNFDGEYLASGSIDKTIKVFNFNTKETFTLRGHTDWVNQVRLDIASRVVFSASDDCTVKLWDLDTKTCIKTFEGHVGQVQQILLMPDDFEPDDFEPHQDSADTLSVSSGRSGTPLPASQHATQLTPPLQDSLSTPTDDRAGFGSTFTNDMSRPLPPMYMLTAGLDSTIRLWETSSGRCLHTFFGHLEGIWGLVGDTLRIVTGANDAMVKVWEPRSGKCERTFTGHAGPVTCVCLSDSRLASGSEDGEVKLYTFEGDDLAVEECGTPF